LDNRPIGVFDSGLGGLTVFSALTDLLKDESIVYFGDNGRYPYGTKSSQTVVKYTLQNIKFLIEQDVKMIVIACNTASACSFNVVKDKFGLPIIEVVKPGALTAVNKTKNKRIGVIGTAATVNSKVYETAIKTLDGGTEVFSKACPIFVPLVEEGWWETDIALSCAKEYLSFFEGTDIDTLVLGCTHYPLLHKTISKVLGEKVELVNSALEVAKAVKEVIINNNLQRNSEIEPVYRYYTSDSADKFEDLGGTILNKEIRSVQKIDIEKY